MYKMMCALSIALGTVASTGAFAQSSVTSSATTTTTANAQTQASNEGVTTSINSYGSPDSNVHYSGVTGSNTAVGLGSFSSSFSPDYCGGVSQTGVSVPYATFAHGEPKAGVPGVWCDDQRTSVHAMEFAATFGNAAMKALDLAAVAKKNDDKDAEKQYLASSKYYADESKKLSTFAVYMQCGHSTQARRMARAAGIDCPLSDAEESSKSDAAANKVRQDAMARGEPVDPLVRSRMGLDPLSQ